MHLLLISQLKGFGSMLSIDCKRPHKYRSGVMRVGYGSETSAKSNRRQKDSKDTRGGGKLQAKEELLLHRLVPQEVTGAYPRNYGL